MASIAKHKPVTIGVSKAWSNLNGTGVIAERDSFNITGYTDNGTGDFTFTLSANMADTNYFIGGMGGRNAADLINLAQPRGTTVPTVSAVRLNGTYINATLIDVDYAGMQLLGGLA